MYHTPYHYQIHPIRDGKPYNWLFLPGGPGFGSAYLRTFCQQLKLPGSIYLIDFPKDGLNAQGILDINYWQKGLIDLLKSYSNAILVTHSFSGMFALHTPEIEPHLSGLVLMNTTTKNSFFEHIAAMQNQHQLPDLLPSIAEYHLHPSQETYKNFWQTYKYYCFTPEELEQGEQMIPLFAFNNEAYYFAIEHFYPYFNCRWQPNIPTLILSSECDSICPPDVFSTDPLFQKNNIIHKLIKNAGHCPWLSNIEQVQTGFDELIKSVIK